MQLMRERKINFIPLDIEEWNCPVCGKKAAAEELKFYNDREREEYFTYGLCAKCGREIGNQLKK